MPKRYKNYSILSRRSLSRHFNNVSTSRPVPMPEDERLISQVALTDDGLIHDNENNDDVSTFSSTEAGRTGTTEDLRFFLIQWKFDHNVNVTALNSLLIYLRENGHPYLPKDSRTLLKTPRQHTFQDISPGKYSHIGVKKGLELFLTKFDLHQCEEILLSINIDGVPLSKSSNKGFWTILAKSTAVGANISDVFVIGLYLGYAKPSNFADFMRPHIDDLKNVTKEFIYNERPIKIKVENYICDAPARASVAGTKGHSAYFGCSKCVQEGEYDNRMLFPDTDSLPRTNDDFRRRVYDCYHKYTSPLEELDDFDMIKDIPLDYMHVVLLGVMKKLIKMWMSGDPLSLLPSRDIKKISEQLLITASTQPSEFQRKIRGLNDAGHFKATEFRTFLLYTGPVVLENILTIEKYHHFLLFHAAIYILCDKSLYRQYNELARCLLKKFVERFSDIYGTQHLIYNVHSLVHLVDDCLRFGPLDTYSAFPFESYNYQLVKLLHKHNTSLSEITNRITEMSQAHISKRSSTELKNSFPIVKKKKTINSEMVYHEIVLKEFKLNKTLKNKWFLTENNDIVKFDHVKQINGQCFIFGFPIKEKTDFYNIPVCSRNFNIYKSEKKFEAHLNSYTISSVAKKLFMMDTIDKPYSVFIPLIHT